MNTMQKVYADAQAACGLKVSDYVRVTHKAESNESGWVNYWNEEMDKYVGKIGEIIDDRKYNGFCVKFSTHISWDFPYFVLEKVLYEEMHKASRLKKGDKVKITRKAEDNEAGWGDVWNHSMDKYVGKIGIINMDNGGYGFAVKFSVDQFHFPCFILEKVEEETEVTIPNGIPQDILESIKASLHHSREKHPVFASSKEQAVCLLTEEVGEVAMAVNDNNNEAIKKELLDVIAVCLRWLEGEVSD